MQDNLGEHYFAAKATPICFPNEHMTFLFIDKFICLLLVRHWSWCLEHINYCIIVIFMTLLLLLSLRVP